MNATLPRSPTGGPSLLAFFLLTYLVSWSLFIGGAALSGAPALPSASPSGLGGLVIILGVFAPSLVALALTAGARGRAGAAALLKQVIPKRVAAQWYVFAIVFMAAIKLGAALLHRLTTGKWPAFGGAPLFLMALSLLFSTPMQAGEEIGWRGFALPRLADRVGLARASVLLGVIWAFWHLPFFFIPVSDTFHQSFPVYLLQVTALSVVIAWLYWRTESLFLVMLLHAAVNNTKDVVPSAVSGASNPFTASASRVAWFTVALLWVCAAYFLAQMSSRSPTGQETAENREARLAGEAAASPERTEA
jgi:membrane protease YdiL (CAAX protease family)